MTIRSLLHIAPIVALVGLAAACSSTVAPFSDDDGDPGPGPDPQCQGFEDETAVTPVTVTISNDGDNPIYISGIECTNDIDLRLYDATGNELGFRHDDCSFTCEELQEQDPICAAACAIAPVIMIAPGGSYDLTWNGTVFQQEQMPDACHFSEDFAPDNCDQRVSAAPGNYEVEITAYTSTTCDGLDEECSCEPNADGNCQIDGWGQVDGPSKAKRDMVTFPSSTSAEIVFQ